MKIVRNIARFIVAPVFIFSGFVKAIDPLGSTYKFTDYFDAFGFDFLSPLAFTLAIILSTAELTIGISLLMGNLMRVTSWALLIFMSFFTILTFISALTNPVTDCGCFGDALILTNWQTFWKNIVLMAPTIFIFLNRNNFKPFTPKGSEWCFLGAFILIGICISIHNYRNLPALDFRPYKIGTNIPSSMIIPDDAEKDSVTYVFVYSKNEIQKEFSLDSLPDSTWSYVDRIDKIIKKGYVPPIHDFSLTSLDGDDYTNSVLTDPGFSLLIISHNLNKSDGEGLKATNAFAQKMKENGVKVYGMTGSTKDDIKKYSGKYTFCFDFYTCDETALKTTIRANPGIILLKQGTVLNMWHYRNLPKIDKIKGDMLSFAISDLQKQKSELVIGFYLLLFCLIVIGVLLATSRKN
jgi:uncharacterized membrane protein YphA (DoxX/SURF4 family)